MFNSSSQSALHRPVSRTILTSWILLNLLFSSAGLVMAEDTNPTVFLSPESTESTGSWGKISPISYSYSSGKPQPGTVEEKTPLRGAILKLPISEPSQRPIAPLQMVEETISSPLQPVLFLFLLFGLGALFGLYSKNVVFLGLSALFLVALAGGVQAIGCCTGPVPSQSLYVCLNVEENLCCGTTNVTDPDWLACDVAFVDTNVNCYDGSVPACSNVAGCCVYEQGCADVQYQAQCSGGPGAYRPNQQCSSIGECQDVCCIWQDNNDASNQFCDVMSLNTCDDYNETLSFPPDYVNSSHMVGTPAITGYYQCQDECANVVYSLINITGFVFNQTAPAPLFNATVSNGVIESATDVTGAYSLLNTYSGGIFIEVSAPGFSTLTHSFTSLVNIQQNYTLGWSGISTIEGQVFFDLGGGNIYPAPGAMVVVDGVGFAYSVTVPQTDGEGRFSVPDVPGNESYNIYAYYFSPLTTYTPGNVTGIWVEAGTTVSQTLFVSPTNNQFMISGHVYNRTGGDVGHEVEVEGIRSEGGGYVNTTVSNGNFYLSNVSPGTYTLQAINLFTNESSSIVTLMVNITDVANINITIVNRTETGQQQPPNLLCIDNLSGYGCCLVSTCAPINTLGWSSDCSSSNPNVICCASPCVQSSQDTDGDGTPDWQEPFCMWEPARVDSQMIASESQPPGFCADGIDNDCDSTGYGPFGYDTNKEDELDDDCRYCPLNECDYPINSYCNETASQLNGAVNWTQYNLSIVSENNTYCGNATLGEPGLCSLDNDCGPSNQCVANGGTCCTLGCNGTELTPFSQGQPGGCPLGRCCLDDASPICESPQSSDYECAEFEWQCTGGQYYNLQYPAVCTAAEPVACALDVIQVPQCVFGELIDNRTVNEHTGFLMPPGGVNFGAPPPPPYAAPVDTNSTHCDCGGISHNISQYAGYCCNLGGGWVQNQSEQCPVLQTGQYYFMVTDANMTGYCSDITNLFYYGPDLSVLFERTGYNEPPHPCGIEAGKPAGECSGTLPNGTWDVTVRVSPGIDRVWSRGNITIPLNGINSTSHHSTPTPFSTDYWCLGSGIDCSANPPPPVQNFTIENWLGLPDLQLKWESRCSAVTSFIINKSDGGDFVPIGPALLPVDVCIGIYCTFHDEFTEWNTTYNYTIEAVHGMNYSDVAWASKYTGDQICEGKTHVGEEFCMNYTSPNPFGDYPLTWRARCVSDNQSATANTLDHPWIAGNGNCSDEGLGGGPNHVCIGPNSTFKTQCLDPGLCAVNGSVHGIDGPYALGLYFNRTLCEYEYVGGNWDEKHVCYWEYSDTVVDQCLDCAQNKTCFEYDSQDACTRDWCFAYNNPAPQTNCSWIPTWPEFGKGICTKTNYTGDDMCHLCSADSEIFKNPKCTASICSQLGDCFSDGTECRSCGDYPTCIMYPDEESCEGLSTVQYNISTTLCPVAETLSGDSCSVGKCAWIPEVTPPEKCRKDADSNGRPDCLAVGLGGDLVSGAASYCVKDNQPPRTTIVQSPLFLNLAGDFVNFSVIDQYFGKGMGRSGVMWNITACPGGVCPAYNCTDGTWINATGGAIQSNDMWIYLPNDYEVSTGTQIPQGNVILTYFAMDMYSNLEFVRSFPFFIDTIPPEITFGPLVRTNNTLNLATSDLLIQVNTSLEDAACQDANLAPLVPPQGTGSISNGGFVRSRFVTWTNISDGSYTFSINCTDQYGNWNRTSTPVTVGRMGLLFDMYPDSLYTEPPLDERLNNIFGQGLIRFYAKAPFDAGLGTTCYLMDPGLNVTPEAFPPQNITRYAEIPLCGGSTCTVMVGPVPNATGNGYFLDVSGIDDGNVEENLRRTIVCRPGDIGMDDLKNDFYYSRDSVGPDTVLEYRDELNWWHPFTGGYWHDLRMRVRCDDGNYVNEGGEPGEAQCANITKCEVLSPSLCIPGVDPSDTTTASTLEFDLDDSKTICWTTFDKKGNEQPGGTRCVGVTIDQSMPNITITAPTENIVQNLSAYLLQGIWADESNVTSIFFWDENNFPVSGGYITVVSSSPANGTFTSGNSTQQIPIDLEVGENFFLVEGFDQAGNPGYDEVTFWFDNISPNLEQFIMTSPGGPAYNDTVEYGYPLTLSFRVNDVNFTAEEYQQNEIWLMVFNSSGTPLTGYPQNFVLPINETILQHNITPALNSSGDYDIPEEQYYISFSYSDRLANTEQKDMYAYFIVNDTIGPNITVNITDANTNYPGGHWLLLTDHDYTVTVNVSEPLNNSYINISYGWDGGPCNAYTIGATHFLDLTATADPLVYTGTLFLDNTSYYCLRDVDDGEVFFFAHGTTDRNGVTVTRIDPAHSDGYHIDVKSADAVAFHYPTTNDNFAYVSDMGANNLVTITGFSDSAHTPSRDVNVRMLRRDTPLDPNLELPGWTAWNETHSGVSGQNNPANTGYTATVQANQTAGASILQIDSSEFNVGYGASISTHALQTGEYYEILNNVFQGGFIYNINVTPVLAENVSTGAALQRYNWSEPSGWFSMNFTLNLSEGMYHFYGYGTDDHGIESNSPGYMGIVYDNSSPNIQTYTPTNGRITSEQNFNVTFTAIDSVSGFIVDSIRIDILTGDNTSSQNGSYGCSSSGVSCIDDVTSAAAIDGAHNITVIYDASPLDFTTYDVDLFVEDQAGNNDTRAFTFEIRTGVPGEPDMILHVGNFFVELTEPMWYVNVQSGFTGNLSFPNDAEVNITQLIMTSQPGAEPTYQNTSLNTFDLNFSVDLRESQNPEDHSMDVWAMKKIDTVNWSAAFPVSTERIIVDLTDPVLTYAGMVERSIGTENRSVLFDDLTESQSIIKTMSPPSYTLASGNLSGSAESSATQVVDNLGWRDLTVNYVQNEGTVYPQFRPNRFAAWQNLTIISGDTYDISTLPLIVDLRVVIERADPANATPDFSGMNLTYSAGLVERLLVNASHILTIQGDVDDLHLTNGDVLPMANRVWVNYTDPDGTPPDSGFVDGTVAGSTWSAALTLRQYPQNRSIDLVVHACDKASNCISNPLILLYDAIPPSSVTLSASVPENSWVPDDNITFNWTASSDFSGIRNYEIYLDGAANPVLVPGTQEYYIWDSLTTGEHELRVRAVDHAGNRGPFSSYNLDIDHTPPAITNIVVDPPAVATASDFTVTATITDEGEGLIENDYNPPDDYLPAVLVNGSGAYCNYPIYQGNDVFLFNCDISGYPYDGTLTLNITAQDETVGNNGSATATLIVDTQPPVITTITSVAHTNQNTNLFSLVTDEVANCEYRVGTGGTWTDFNVEQNSTTPQTNITINGDGTYIIYFRCTDELGNTMTVFGNTTITLDQTAPLLQGVGYGVIAHSIPIPPTNYSTNSTINVWGTSEQGARIEITGGASAVTYQMQDINNATVQLRTIQSGFYDGSQYITSIDMPINSTLTFQNDMAPWDALLSGNLTALSCATIPTPAGTQCNQSLNTAGRYFLNLTVNNSGNIFHIGVLYITVGQVDNMFNLSVPLNVGLNFLTVAAYDYLDNVNISGPYAVSYDNSIPAVENRVPDDDETTPDFQTTIAFDVTDIAGSGVDWSTFNMTVVVGNNLDNYYCEYPNTACINNATVSYGALPRVVFTGPNGWINQSTTMWYTNVNVTVNVQDYTGQQLNSEWRFLIDNATPTRPTIYIDDEYCDVCTTLYITNASPGIRVVFTEPVHIDQAIVNGTDITLLWASTDNLTFDWSTTGFAENTPIQFQINATKLSAGRMGHWYQNFTVDSAAPADINISEIVGSGTGSVNASAGYWVTRVTEVNITVEYTENYPQWLDISGSGVSPKRVDIRGQSGPITTNISLTGGAGSKTITVTVTDMSNQTASDSFTIFLDNVPPVGTFTVTANGTNVKNTGHAEYGQGLNFTFTVTDASPQPPYGQNNYGTIDFQYANGTSFAAGTFPYDLTFGTNVTTATYDVQSTLSNGIYSLPVGSYRAFFDFGDAIGNAGAQQTANITVNDTIVPSILINITDDSGQYPGWLLQTGHTYQVSITTSEALLNDSLNISYYWDGSPLCTNSGVRYFTNMSNSDRQTYSAQLYLPTAIEDSCIRDVNGGNVIFTVEEATDLNGVSGATATTAEAYKIDTFSEGQVQFFHPVLNLGTVYLNGDANQAGDLVGYSDLAHSPDRDLTVFMVKRDTPVNPSQVLIYTGWNDSVTETSAATPNQSALNAAVAQYDRPVGQSWVVLDNNQVLGGMGIVFAGHDRETEAFYTTSSPNTLPNGDLNITISPALEGNVTVGEGVTLYDLSEPAGWFEADFNLNLGQGRYYFYGFVDDEHGLTSTTPSYTSIVYDSSPPNFLDGRPTDGTITSETSLNISASINDSISGLVVDSVVLSILSGDNTSVHNGTYTCSDAVVSCVNTLGNQSTDGELEMSVVYNNGALDNTTYSMSLHYEDRAGNYRDSGWSFEIRSSYPGEPELWLDTGYEFLDTMGYMTWYVPVAITFDGILTFVDDGEVNLTATRMLYQPGAEPTDSRLSNNSFALAFNTTLIELQHRMSINATKRVNQTAWSADGLVATKYITIDLSDPVLNLDNQKSRPVATQSSSMVLSDLSESTGVLKVPAGAGYDYSLTAGFLSGTASSLRVSDPNWISWDELTLDYSAGEGNVTAQYSTDSFIWNDLTQTSPDVYDISSLGAFIYFRAVLARANVANVTPVFHNMTINYTSSTLSSFLTTNTPTPTISGNYVDLNMDDRDNTLYTDANRIRVSYTDNGGAPPASGNLLANMSGTSWFRQLILSANPPERVISVGLDTRDKAGRQTLDSITLIYDSVPPNPVTITSATSPPPAWVSATSATFDWNIPADYSGVEYFHLYQDDDTANFTSLPGTTTSYTWAGITTGQHRFRVRAEDYADNPGLESDYVFWVDNSAPTVTGVTVTPSSTSSTFTVTATMTDEGEGILANPRVFVNGSASYCVLSNVAGDVFTFSCDISSISGYEGSLTVNVTVEDASVGNVGYATSTISIDTGAPIITSIQHVSATNNDSVLITLTTSEVASCDIATSATGPWTSFNEEQNSTSPKTTVTITSDGVHTYYYRCTDLLGNMMSYTENSTITRDTTAPDLSGVGVWPIEYTSISRGVSYVKNATVWVYGDSEQQSTILIHVGGDTDTHIFDDRVSPVIQLTGSGFSDGINIINTLTVPIDSTVTWVNTFAAAPVSLNSSTLTDITIAGSQNASVTYDSISVHTIDYYANGIYMDTLILTVRNVSDTFNYSATVEEGLNFVQAQSVDALGNTNTSGVMNIWYDPASPFLTNVEPEADTIMNDFTTTIEFDVTDVDSGVRWNTFNMTVSHIGADYDCWYFNTSCSGGATISFNVTHDVVFTAPGGSFNVANLSYLPIDITVNVEDWANWLLIENWSFTLDNAAPNTPTISVDGDSCDDGCTLYTTTVGPQIVVTFDNPVRLTSATNEGNNVLSSMVPSNGNRTWTLPSGSNSGSSSFSLSAIRLDAGGSDLGRSGTWSQQYTVDGSAPSSVSINSVTNTGGAGVIIGSSPSWSTTERAVTIGVTWTESNPATLSITGGVSPSVTMNITGSSRNVNVNLSTGDGPKTVIATVTDQGGLSNSSSATVTVDTTGPLPAILFSPLWTATNQNSTTLLGQASSDADRLVVTVANTTDTHQTTNVDNTMIYSGEIETSYSLFDNSTGDNHLRLSGGNCTDLLGQWLQFTNTYSVPNPRFNITECIGQFGDAVSLLTLDSVAPATNTPATVYIYNNKYPDGYFTIDVNMTPGENLVQAIAYDNLNNSATPSSLLLIRDDSLQLTVSLIQPSDMVISQADFGSGTYDVTVSTNYVSTCTIAHASNIIAGSFAAPMSTSGGTSHSYTFNTAQCAENGGNYCMIGGTYNYQRYYDRFTVTCSATTYEVDDGTLVPCLTIATYTSTQGQPSGENICNASIGMCGTDTTDPTTSCRDCTNFDNDQTGCAANVCMWCDSQDTCSATCNGVDCASEPLDYGDDLVCDASCASYGNQSTCTSSGFCNWCSDSDTCLESCTSCTGSTLEYTGDNVCDADCNEISGETSCTDTNYCLWCDGDNSCGTSCTSCTEFPDNYGNDFVCDVSCATNNGNQTSCQATNYCMWCPGGTCGDQQSCPSCTDYPENYFNDYVCDVPCTDHTGDYNACTGTNTCLWCPSSFACGDDCTTCSQYNVDYYNDQVCDQPGTGNNYGFIT